MHNQNLQSEIEAFVTSLNGANVTKDTLKQLNERQRLILGIIAENNAVTIPEMSRKTAVTERTIKRDIEYLQQLGLLHREGGRKEGHWKLTH